MIPISVCTLVCFLVVFRTNFIHRFSSGYSSLLSSSIVNFPIISIRCAFRYAHVISLSRHYYASPYGSRGEGKRLKFSCFSSAVKLPELKTLYQFSGYL